MCVPWSGSGREGLGPWLTSGPAWELWRGPAHVHSAPGHRESRTFLRICRRPGQAFQGPSVGCWRATGLLMPFRALGGNLMMWKEAKTSQFRQCRGSANHRGLLPGDIPSGSQPSFQLGPRRVFLLRRRLHCSGLWRDSLFLPLILPGLGIQLQIQLELEGHHIGFQALLRSVRMASSDVSSRKQTTQINSRLFSIKLQCLINCETGATAGHLWVIIAPVIRSLKAKCGSPLSGPHEVCVSKILHLSGPSLSWELGRRGTEDNCWRAGEAQECPARQLYMGSQYWPAGGGQADSMSYSMLDLQLGQLIPWAKVFALPI